MRTTGRCLCGAVSYAGDAAPQFQVKCYCTACRKKGAAGHAAYLVVAGDTIDVSGEVRAYRHKADSGNEVTHAFCPACGSGVYELNSAMAGTLALNAATLDAPDIFSPQMVVFASRAPAWDAVNFDGARFDEMPPRG